MPEYAPASLRGTGPRVLLIGSALVLAFGFALSSILASPETYPWADTAMTSLYALRAARGELSVGAYSRFGWNHPGPLLYELLAPLYAICGYREISLKWAALAINLLCVGSALMTARRRSPRLAVMIAVALLPLIWREQRLLFSAWNPLIAVLPLVLTIVLSAALAEGDAWLMPFLGAAASLVVQSHVGYTAVVVATVIVAAIRFRGSSRARDDAVDQRSLLRSCVVTAAVLVILWLPALMEEVSGSPGNLSRLLAFFFDSHAGRASWPSAFVIFAGQLVGPLAPGWALTTSSVPDHPSPIAVAAAGLELTLLLIASAVACRRREPLLASFSVICATASFAALISVRSVIGPVTDYLVFWIAAVGMLNLACIVSVALNLIWIERHRRFWTTALTVYLVFLAAIGSFRLQTKHLSDARVTTVRALSIDLANYCQRHQIHRPLFGFSWTAWQEAVGLVLQFHKRELPITLPDQYLYLGGPPFAKTGREDAEFYLMPVDGGLPVEVKRFQWVTTHGAYRIVQLFRDARR